MKYLPAGGKKMIQTTINQNNQAGKEQKEKVTSSRNLLRNRILFISREIDNVVANEIIESLLLLEAENSEADINLYINSPGGGVQACLAIYDAMQHIKPDIATICIGEACSGGALLLAAGTKGKRYCFPNSRVMIHQLLGGIGGEVAEIKIQVKECARLKNLLNEILSKHTGQPLQNILQDTERDFFMSPEEAKAYGLIDEVLVSRKIIKN